MAVEVKRIQRNPLDWALDRIGVTRAEFQVEYGYSKPYLLRISQGRQSQMGDRVVGDLYRAAETKGIDLDEEILGVYGGALTVPEAYDHWVHQHRKAQVMPEPVKDSKVNPFMRLVKAVGSVSRMSALLAAPDQLVERYAKGVHYGMPMPVMMALTDMGYPHIRELDEAMRAWERKEKARAQRSGDA